VCADEIVILMAGAALFCGYAVAFRAAPHVHRVGMAIIALAGEVAARMTIHAAGMA
jgi:hypothetical protein